VANFYVDATLGDDDDDGTIGEPWQTIAKVNASSFSAGASILFKKGETWREQLTVPSSGSDGQPVTFGAYGNGDAPKILGSDQLSTWAVYGDAGDNIWSCSHTGTIYEVWFINASDGKTHWGNPVASAAACVAEYDWFYDSNVVYCYAASDPDARYTSVEGAAREYGFKNSAGKAYITVDGLEIAYSYQACIWFDGSDANHGIVQNCTLHHTGLYPYSIGYGNGIRNTGASGLMSGNTIYECATHGIWIHAKSAQSCTNSIAQNNTVYNCYHVGIDVWNYFANATSSGHVVKYNTVYLTADYADTAIRCDGIQLYCESTGVLDSCQVYYNVVYNILGHGIGIEKYVTNAAIKNNSLYKSHADIGAEVSAGIYVASLGVTGIVIQNNVAVDFVSGCLKVIDKTDISTCDNNCWYQSAGGTAIYTNVNTISYHYDDQAAYQLATEWDASGLWEDPDFTDAAGADFSLKSTSPCINVGANVGLSVDIEGTSIVGNPDVGAYEYVSGAVPLNHDVTIRLL